MLCVESVGLDSLEVKLEILKFDQLLECNFLVARDTHYIFKYNLYFNWNSGNILIYNSVPGVLHTSYQENLTFSSVRRLRLLLTRQWSKCLKALTCACFFYLCGVHLVALYYTYTSQMRLRVYLRGILRMLASILASHATSLLKVNSNVGKFT
jgi:hypothetical protein